MGETWLQASGLTKRFDMSGSWLARKLTGKARQVLTAVDDVSIAVPTGSTYALVGESGSGKSTIAQMVVGLLRPDEGTVQTPQGSLFDKDNDAQKLRQIRQRMQMVFQSPYSSLNPRWRVGDILLEPVRAFGLISGHAAQQDRLQELLTQVGLSANDASKYPHEFSGGQRQRIAIARALASEPSFIVCDEPTSALDVSVQAQVLNLLKRLQNDLGVAYLFISHDMAVVRVMAHTIGVLKDGKLVEEQEAESLFSAPKHPYTQALIEATPTMKAA